MYGNNSNWLLSLMGANRGINTLYPGISIRTPTSAPTRTPERQPTTPTNAASTGFFWNWMQRNWTGGATGGNPAGFGLAGNPWPTGGTSRYFPAPGRAPRPAPTPGPGSQYTPLNLPVWVPQQANMRPEQWSGIPYTRPTPQAAPRPQQQGTPGAGTPRQFPGSNIPGLPWLPPQAFMTPEQWSGIPPERFALYTKPEGGGGGGGYGGYGGYLGWGRGRGGGAKQQKPGTISLIPQRGFNWNGGASPTGRQLDINNAAMGYIHWRV